MDAVAGRADISTGSGRLQVREIDGPAVVKNSNGDSWIGLVTGDLRINAANGDIAVDRAGAGVVASTANGDVRVGAVDPRHRLAEDRLRRDRGRHPGRHRGQARRVHLVRPGPQPARVRRGSTGDGRDARPARPQRLRRHRDPPGHREPRGSARESSQREWAQNAVEVTGLRKSYGPTLVLDGIDLAVPEGTVFALLGPNGAGKTTTVEILSTLIPADAGTVRVAGHDVATEPDAVRAAIGVTGQFSAVDGFLTGRENLLLMADLLHLGRDAGRRTAAELLERFELDRGGRPGRLDVLRRHEAAARPGHDAGRAARG